MVQFRSLTASVVFGTLVALVLGQTGDETIANAVREALALFDAQAGQVLHLDDTDSADQGQLTKFSSEGVPTVIMHGMGDFGSNPLGMLPMRDKISQITKSYARSIELCSTPDKMAGCALQDQRNGFLMPMYHQVEQFAKVVRSDPKLANGFNALGLSQGNTVIRAYIHMYNDPPVRSFLSMHGIMMGVASLPHCSFETPGLGTICEAVDKLVQLGVETPFVQAHLAQANYFRDPTNLENYRKFVKFLPFINNEAVHFNATFGNNFKSLDKLILVMAAKDTIVIPKESEHFGYYKDGSQSEVWGMSDAPWYKDDWFGLRPLDEAKKIDFHQTSGDHLQFDMSYLEKLVLQYFTGVVEPTSKTEPLAQIHL